MAVEKAANLVLKKEIRMAICQVVGKAPSWAGTTAGMLAAYSELGKVEKSVDEMVSMTAVSTVSLMVVRKAAKMTEWME